MKYLSNRILISVLIVLVIGVLGLSAHKFGSLEWLIENEANMRGYVDSFPLQSWLVGLAIYTLFSLVPGTTGKSVVLGWLFGFWPAVLIVDIGLSIAAIISFVSARYLFRNWVRQQFGELIEKFSRLLNQDASFYLLTLRFAHVPFSFVNYAAAATSTRLFTFSWTTVVGVLPGATIFVFVGTRIPTLRSLAENGVSQLVDPMLIAILAGTVALPALVNWAIARYRKRQAKDHELAWEEIESVETNQ